MTPQGWDKPHIMKGAVNILATARLKDYVEFPVTFFNLHGTACKPYPQMFRGGSEIVHSFSRKIHLLRSTGITDRNITFAGFMSHHSNVAVASDPESSSGSAAIAVVDYFPFEGFLMEVQLVFKSPRLSHLPQMITYDSPADSSLLALGEGGLLLASLLLSEFSLRPLPLEQVGLAEV